MRASVDLNADLGEGAASEGELLQLVSSANIACWISCRRSEQHYRVDPGAHTRQVSRSVPTRVWPIEKILAAANCGSAPKEIFALVTYQLGAFQAIAAVVRREAESRQTAWRTLQHGGARPRAGRGRGARDSRSRSLAHSFRAR